MSLRSLGKRLTFPGFTLGTRSRRRVVKHFLREPNIQTLDVGSGNGFFAGHAARRAGPGSNVLSFSFNPQQIEECKEFLPLLRVPPGSLEFRVMTAEQVDQLQEKFDQILLLEVIEHLDDDLAVVKKLAGHLKPGGIMHVTTPDNWHGPKFAPLDRMATGGHCRIGYTWDRMYRLLTDAGLDVAYQTRIGGLGMFLTRPQNAIGRAIGGLPGLTLAFALVYPLYLLVEWIPIPQSWRAYHYAIGRKRAGTS